jgi:hypothetical protein
MLLLRCRLAEAGVCDPNRLPGAKLCRWLEVLAKMLFDTDRRAVNMPVSAIFPPDDDRWKTG